MRLFKVGFLIVLLVTSAAGCARLKSESDRDNWSVEKFYSEAQTALSKKRYESAIELYQALEARYPYGPYTDQAHIDTIYAYYKKEEPESAIAAADRYIRLHPTDPGVDYAYYIKGLVNFNESRNFLDRWLGAADLSNRDPTVVRESFLAFRELVTRFPDSRYAENARQRMTHLLNVLAMHDIHVAEYYFRRGAYVAAVNRCKRVIEEYQQTPAVEHALGLMGISYQRMGMRQLADDTVRVLEINFPESDYIVAVNKGGDYGARDSWLSRLFKRRQSDSGT